MKFKDRIIIHKSLYSKVLTLLIGGIAGLQVGFGQFPVPPSSTLVSWWTGDLNATDRIGTNAGVPIGGATYAAGKVGEAFSFNGTNSGVLVANSPSLNFGAGEDFSMETWIKARPIPAKEILVIVDKRVTPNIYQATGYSLCLDNGFLCLQLANGPANQNYWSPPNLRDDQWHHVAVSVKRNDPTGGRLYVDGQEILVFNPTPFSGSLSNNAPLKIGYHADPSYDGDFSGLIDELSIYRSALGSNEIVGIFQAGAAGKRTSNTPVQIPSGLAAWWKGESNVVDSVSGLSGWLTNGAGFAAGKVGLGFSLDGVNDRVLAPISADMNFGPNQDFSIETWIQAFPTPGNYMGLAAIFGKTYARDASSAVGWLLYMQDGRLGFLMSAAPVVVGGSSYWSALQPNLQDGQFHHLAVSVVRSSANGGKLYVDGDVVLTFDPRQESGDLSNNEPLLIGNHPNPNLNCFFKGVIDEVSLYNRALTPAEISAVYQAGAAGKANPAIDDGIPDEWRINFFGANSQNDPRIAANADPDQDGANNYEEFLAGSNPLDPNSKPTNAVALVVFDPAGAEFTNFVSVNLTTPVVNGTIKYAIDDLSATNASPLTRVYSDPVQTDAASTIRAMVYVNGYPVSRIYSNTYVRVYAIDDGIPNDWREEYFGVGYRTDPRVAAGADPDGDGANNLGEYFAGTDPTDPKSVLKIAGIRLVPVVTWDSVSNKLYRVLRRDDINRDEWVALKPLVRATNSESSFTDYAATNRNAFYWIEPVTP